MKNLYEVFDEFEEAISKKAKMAVIERNLSQTLVDVLRLTFDPQFQFLVTEMPENYTIVDYKDIPGKNVVKIITVTSTVNTGVSKSN